MAGERHNRDALAAFLDRQYRQVWAVHRETGERVFIDWGEATPAMRAYAKAHLCCPVPGCDLRISARGRSKRDHFFHLGTPGHGEGEGEWHLQAKALLTAWANKQPGASAQEEESVAVPASGSLRRADVMATWSEPTRKVALEVEYKDYKPEDWARKQGDYDSVGVACTWVFGHLPRYLRQPRKPKDHPEDQTWEVLQWVELTAAVARAGRPVIFINPVERAVVTAVQWQEPFDQATRDLDWWRREDQVGPRLAHPDCSVAPTLALDPLDDCRLDPQRGLVTPTMERIERSRAGIQEAASEAKARAEVRAAEAAKRLQERREALARRQAEQERQRAEAAQKLLSAEQAWLDSDLRQRLLDRYDGSLPPFLTTRLPNDRGVRGHPAHWHSHLFEALVFGDGRFPKVGRIVTVPQVYAIVSSGGFALDNNRGMRSSAISGYLMHLHHNGVLAVQVLDARGTIGDIRVLSDGREAPQPLTEQPPRQNATPPSQAIPMPAGPASRNDQDIQAPTPSAEEAPTDESDSPRAKRWQESMLCRTVLKTWNGSVPAFLSGDDTPDLAEAIDALPEHWHSYLYLKHVHDRPSGHTFTLREACETLDQHRLVRGHSAPAAQAVTAYLHRLSSATGLLAAPDATDPDQRYYVTRN